MSDGREAGPVDLATIGVWVSEGRVRADGGVMDTETGRRFLVAEHPFLRTRLPAGAAAAPPPVPVLGIHGAPQDLWNNSGERGGDVPHEARGFHWGALGFGVFGWGWMWAFSHGAVLLGAGLLGVYLVHLYLAFGLRGAGVARPIASLLNLAYLGVGIYFGVTGGRIAWRNRRFADVADFVACRRVWGWWALGVLLGSFLLLGVVAAFFVWLDASRG